MATSWKLECRYPDMLTGQTVTAVVGFNRFAVGNGFTTGRPLLLARLWPAIRMLCESLNPRTAKQTRHMIRRFWLFLDHMDALKHLSEPKAQHIDDLQWSELELLWRHWVDWLRSSNWSEREVGRTFWFVKKMFDTAFELEREHGHTEKEVLELFGYFRTRPDITIAESIEFEDIRKIFKAIRKRWFESVARVTEFNEIADTGWPHWKTVGDANRRREFGYWEGLGNRLRFLRDYFPWKKGWVSRCPLKRPDERLAAYKPPAWTPITPWSKKGSSLSTHLGAIYLTFDDLAMAIALVAMKTPFNTSTIGSLRASHWFVRDPQHPEKRVVIFARKARARGRLQKAYSSIRSTSDPYAVIKTVIERTEPLRNAAREAAAQMRNRQDRSEAEDRELTRLERLSDAVWLCPSPLRGVVDVGETLGAQANERIHQVLNKILVNEKAKDGGKLRFRLKDGREMWARYVYERSGYSLLLTQFALSHSGLESLARYLNNKALRVRNFLKLSRLQERVFSELSDQKYDPLILRRLVGDGRMTDDVVAKLRSSVRSSFGLRCTDPKHPDVRADPGHTAGAMCRLQLCPFCSKWYATGDSVRFLQRALLDLESIELTAGVLVWETSSYPLWRALFQGIVSRFHSSIQKVALEKARGMPPILIGRRFAGLGET